LPRSPGKAHRYQYESKKNGSCWVFLAFEPPTGLRDGEVRERRTAREYADFRHRRWACHSPPAAALRLVQDNLHTHTPGSFSEGLPPAEAVALAQQVEPPYTPKKGSWLNRAEIEFAALSQPCLDHRIPAVESLRREVLAWAVRRNREQKTVNWKFAPPDARKKLHRPYQNVQQFM
jgi:DDE superfamily endonuclease